MTIMKCSIYLSDCLSFFLSTLSNYPRESARREQKAMSSDSWHLFPLIRDKFNFNIRKQCRRGCVGELFPIRHLAHINFTLQYVCRSNNKRKINARENLRLNNLKINKNNNELY